MDINRYSSNTSSQFGEDGIISEIFHRIGTRSKCCVEFGAWDGKYLSNTWTLWCNQEWSAVLIEGVPDRHAALTANVANYPKVRPVCAFVRPEGENSLDSILAREKAHQEIDLLSIDVDGDEYYIWRGLQKFRPRVVVIEHNPTIPPEMDLVQLPGEYFGASAGSLVRLAHDKGYQLAACTETNCIFVNREDFTKLGFPEPDIGSIFPRKNLSYLINAYDGRIFLTQNPVYSRRLPEITVALLKEDMLKEVFFLGEKAGVPVVENPGILPVKVYCDPPRPGKLPFARRLMRYLMDPIIAIVNIRWVLDHFESRRKTRQIIKAWKISGRPVPPPHPVKQGVLHEYASRYRLKTLVETGTYLGDMVEAMRHRFDHIYSIELGEELWSKARERFAGFPQITIFQGDSAQVLCRVLKDIQEPTLFWLDGHYSAGITAKGQLETPVLEELGAIFIHHTGRYVILIDDARCFDGTNDYPSLEQLRYFVSQKKPSAKLHVQDDIIRITP